MTDFLIRTTNGRDVTVKAEDIARVKPVYSHDSEGITIVDWDGFEIRTDEDYVALVNRIGTIAPLLKFTRPDGSPVWANQLGIDAHKVRAPLKNEGPAAAKAVLWVFKNRQFVREDVETVKAAVAAKPPSTKSRVANLI